MLSWLDSYVKYASNNEAPIEFHWWSGATILGAALRRQVSFSKEYYQVYPAIWTLMVAPSGAKKTTAVSIAYGIVSRIDHVHLLADKITPEALSRSLSGKDEEGNDREAQGLIYAPELANFLDKRKHNEGLVQLLLRLYDCPDSWVYETSGGGRVPLKNVALTFLGATANDLLYECIPPLALKSGFLARFILIAGKPPPGGIPFPWKDTTLEREVANSLYEISLLKGQMRLPAKARDWYMNWYFAHKAETSKESSTKLRAYYERKPDHLLKLGMIISISMTCRLEFTIEAFKEALDRLETAELDLPQLYEEIDASGTGREQMRVLDQITRAGGWVSHEELLNRNRTVIGDAAMFKRVVTTLIESGLVVMGRDKTSGKVSYRRKR